MTQIVTYDFKIKFSVTLVKPQRFSDGVPFAFFKPKILRTDYQETIELEVMAVSDRVK